MCKEEMAGGESAEAFDVKWSGVGNGGCWWHQWGGYGRWSECVCWM